MEKFNYEKALEKLEEISKKLESGTLSLEETVKLYTEGTKLVSECSKALEKAQLKVKELVSDETDGE